MEFDLANLSIFALTVLIPGIVQSIKEQFGVQGRGAFLVSVLLGFFFVGLSEAINESLIPMWLLPWLRVAIAALAASLAASGYYDLLGKPLRNKLNDVAQVKLLPPIEAREWYGEKEPPNAGS